MGGEDEHGDLSATLHYLLSGWRWAVGWGERFASLCAGFSDHLDDPLLKRVSRRTLASGEVVS